MIEILLKELRGVAQTDVQRNIASYGINWPKARLSETKFK